MAGSKIGRYELYLVLSDLCNFKCTHCINSSGPESHRYRLTEHETSQLIQTINSVVDIEAVNFTGGEPTLHRTLIERVQSEITRPVRYTLTTNGWLGRGIAEFLDKIRIDEITLSYDIFHRPFITKEKLVQFIEAASRKGVEIHLNFVYENVVELSLAQELVKAGANLQTTKLIRSGRAQSANVVYYFDNAVKGTCPSLEPENRRNPLEKVIYIPGKGFTPCCGPLVFDELAPEAFLFTPTIDGLEKTPLMQKLRLGNFSDQAKALGLQVEECHFGSRCEACIMIYGKSVQMNTPSLYQLMEQIESVKYYDSSKQLPKGMERLLEKKFHVKYFCMALFDSISKWHDHDLKKPASIKIKTIQEAGPQLFTDFTMETFFIPFSQHYDSSDREFFLSNVTRYFGERLFGKVYFKGEEPVALISAHQYEPHPATGENTLHVGYWAYKRDSVTMNEARWIKADWFRSLALWSRQLGGIPVDASIDFFNGSAFKMVKARGFRQTCLRLDKRCAP